MPTLPGSESLGETTQVSACGHQRSQFFLLWNLPQGDLIPRRRWKQQVFLLWLDFFLSFLIPEERLQTHT